MVNLFFPCQCVLLWFIPVLIVVESMLAHSGGRAVMARRILQPEFLDEPFCRILGKTEAILPLMALLFLNSGPVWDLETLRTEAFLLQTQIPKHHGASHDID